LIFKFICQDSYEAEKLSSIFTPQKDNSLFVSKIVKTIDNEVVVKLKDGSHHSIMFRDEINSHKLEQFFEELLSRKGQVTDAKYVGDVAFISLSEAVAQ
jgi:acetylornithine deacetylase/succinyl-diaminopimelate desuccinylase-like protein